MVDEPCGCLWDALPADSIPILASTFGVACTLGLIVVLGTVAFLTGRAWWGWQRDRIAR